MSKKNGKKAPQKLPPMPRLPKDPYAKGGFAKALGILSSVVAITVNVAKAAKDPTIMSAVTKVVK
jgi:hypothetical protein